MSEPSPSLAIPDSLDDISPDWLSSAISTRHPDASAETLEFVEAHSGTTGRVRLRVTWNAGSNAPTALFGKLPPTDPLSREMVAFTDMGRREARFYEEVAGGLPIRVPDPIWSGWSAKDPKVYFMLLEDLEDSGCDFPSSRGIEIPGHAERMMDTLATLHGHYWQSHLFDGELAWIERPMRASVGPQLIEEALGRFGERMPADFHALARLYLDHTEAVCDLLDSGPWTLTHGDCHAGNTFLDGDRVGLLDWACVCRAPGMRDVSYYLCNSVSTELRRKSERKLVKRYLERLGPAGGIPPSFEEAWTQYRRLATCSWIAATVTAAAGDRMQSLEVGLRAMERATRAISDLATPALLQAELGP